MTLPISPLHHATYAQRATLAALIRIGGSAKAADVAYETSRSPAYITGMLDNLVNLGIVRRGNERPFPVYSTDLITASITPA
jgi:predicted transcriptional regulator